MQTLFLTATKRCKPLVASLPSDSPSERPLNMHTLDILSQVLFVGLMAMLLYVLYQRSSSSSLRRGLVSTTPTTTVGLKGSSWPTKSEPTSVVNV